MRRTGLRAVIAATVLSSLMAASPARAQDEPAVALAVDQESSSVGFTVSARMLITVQRDGRFNHFTGDVAYNPAHPADTTVNLVVYTDSVDTRNRDHDDLLRSEEFFDAGHHPTMHFISRSAAVQPDGGLAVTGDLTIRGVTKRLVVPIRIIPGAGGQPPAFETTFDIDRTDFGLTGGGPKASGFKVTIGKLVRIRFAIAAARNHPGLRP
jgi:polyisoprenoid-binding protein YceI